MKNKYIYLIWFIALLPAIFLRDYTPNNELRYLSIVDEALQNGNVFTFTNQGEIYADKPPLHFWLMMIGKLILGEHRMWYYSLLSIIPAFVILITMTRWVGRDNDTALILMTTGLFAGAALIVRMDMLMNMFIILSLYTFYQMYNDKNINRNSWLFPIFVFLALFSKGPLGFLIPFISTLIFLIYKKKISHFKRYWGWKSFLIILTGSAIWLTGVYIEGGADYLNNLLVHQTVGRGIDSFHHKEPFYYYLISIWYTLAPWSFLVIGLFIAALIKKRINTTLEQFFAVIIVSTLVMLSIISSKIAIYSLPVVPFFIFLTVLLFNKLELLT
jgi:4-amino-4-deoxy-L-arabinose transferase-like glycosyltransferase